MNSQVQVLIRLQTDHERIPITLFNYNRFKAEFLKFMLRCMLLK